MSRLGAVHDFIPFMLTIRPFRNEDPPRLLELWRRTQHRQDGSSPLFSLSLNQVQTQILGLPMIDSQSIMLAFDKNTPIGYVHTTFAPTKDGYSFDYTAGQICFLCVDPKCHDVPGTAAALIHSGENYLSQSGAQKIFGGSPSPSAPFYTAFYGGGEAVGMLHSDTMVVNAFHEANYKVHQKTVWFHLDLRSNTQVSSWESSDYYDELAIEIREIPESKTWWEGCIQANGIWFDATVYLVRTDRPVARLRIRISYPDTENFLAMYGGTWFASLMELRVHPNFANEKIKNYLLEEVIRYLTAQKQVIQIEAHTAEDSLLSLLLRNQSWQEQDSGYVFVKEL